MLLVGLPLQYSTKYIDKELKQERLQWEKVKQEPIKSNDFLEMLLQRLDERIQEHRYDWIINSLCDLHDCYSSAGDRYLKIDVNPKKAKENHYLSALAGELCYAMVEKGFPHHFTLSGHPYDFKKDNFTFSRNAILANEYGLALKIAGEDTIEGALILQDYEKACAILPSSPEDESIHKDELTQCMWAIAHNDEKMFNKYMKKRIQVLRRQGRIWAVALDSWGLAVIKLARQRGISCNLNVIELPQQLLDDEQIDTRGLILPMADKIHSVLEDENAIGDCLQR